MMHWGTVVANSINQSYHISHRCYPEPLVLAKRNAGSRYEIGMYCLLRQQVTQLSMKALFSTVYTLAHFSRARGLENPFKQDINYIFMFEIYLYIPNIYCD